MDKTITVKGIGSVSTKPDFIVISMTLQNKDKDYTKSVSGADSKVKRIFEAIVSCGHKKTDLKTSEFNVHTEYGYEEGSNGRNRRVLDGYICEYRLKLGFTYNLKLLAETISAIAESQAEPELQIAFTVKNPEKIKKNLLISATKNAKEKAEVLCKASGHFLGELLSIAYNWGEINIYSETDCAMPMMKCASIENMEPEDIESSDSVTFVWKIE